MKKIDEKDYCRGFADATGMSTEDVADKIVCPSDAPLNLDSYEEGFVDGQKWEEEFGPVVDPSLPDEP